MRMWEVWGYSAGYILAEFTVGCLYGLSWGGLLKLLYCNIVQKVDLGERCILILGVR